MQYSLRITQSAMPGMCISAGPSTGTSTSAAQRTMVRLQTGRQTAVMARKITTETGFMSRRNSPALHAAAGRHPGTKEWPGAQHNPVVLKYFRDTGLPMADPMADDETSWCAACVGAIETTETE